MTPKELEAEADALIAKIRPLLAGKPPAVQGLVAGHLLAIYVAGYQAGPERDDILDLEIRLVRDLVPVWDARIPARFYFGMWRN